MSCNRCAGITCHCNRGEPCLLSYQVDSESGSIEFFSGQPGAFEDTTTTAEISVSCASV